jgi:hypothetical protein
MTSNNDRDLEQWAADWQAAPDHVESADQIRRYVKQRTGLLWSFAVADFIVGGIALPVLVYFGVAAESDVERLAMMALASITIATVMFGWWNRRGVLRSSATTIAAYVAISAERLRRMKTAVRIGWVVLLAEVIVFSIWIWDRIHSGTRVAQPGEAQFAWSWLSGFTLLAIFGLVKFGRWVKRDEARFEALQRELL